MCRKVMVIGMKRCRQCGVTVLGEWEICPLCSCVLHEDSDLESQVQPDYYPDIAKKTKKKKKIFWLVTYFSFLTEVLLVVINHLTLPKVHWSMITGVALAYILFTLREILSRRSGHIRKLYFQAAAVLLLLAAIDYALGFQGWSIRYGFPCVLLSFELVILICMIINFANWQNYVTMQIFSIVFSIAYLIVSIAGLGNLVFAWVVFAVCLIFWSTTMMIGGRKAENEVRRKFHL